MTMRQLYTSCVAKYYVTINDVSGCARHMLGKDHAWHDLALGLTWEDKNDAE